MPVYHYSSHDQTEPKTDISDLNKQTTPYTTNDMGKRRDAANAPVQTVSAVGFTPYTQEFSDAFTRTSLNDADHILNFWNVSAGGGSVAHNSGLDLVSPAAQTGDKEVLKQYVRSPLRSEFNFFLQPTLFRFAGLAFTFGGAQEFAKRCQFTLSATDTGEAEIHYDAATAVRLQIQGISGGVRIWVYAKEQSPESAGTLISGPHDTTGVPSNIDLILDAQTFMLFTDADFVDSGLHGLTDSTAWGRRGDAYLTLENDRNISGTDPQALTTHLDSVLAKSLRHSDCFATVNPVDSGFHPAFYDDLGTFYSTHVSKAYNFFTQRQQLRGGFVVPGAGKTRVGFSDSGNTLTAEKALEVACDSAGVVTLSCKNVALTLPEDNDVIQTFPSGKTPVWFTLDLYFNEWDMSVYYSDATTSQFSGNFNSYSYMKPYDWGPLSPSSNGDKNNNGDSALTHFGEWEYIILERTTPVYIADSVFGVVGDGFVGEVPYLDGDRDDVWLKRGMNFLDLGPYYWDRTGVQDGAPALQQAYFYEREWGIHPFLDSYGGGRFAQKQFVHALGQMWERTTAHETNTYLADYIFSPNAMQPMHLRGHPNRPTLAYSSDFRGAGATDFADRIHGISYTTPNYRNFQNNANAGHEWNPQQNAAMNQEFSDINIEVEANGLTGLHLKGAQGSGITNVSVTLPTGSQAACYEGGNGSGGLAYAVEAYGGKHAINMRDAIDYKGDLHDQDAQPGAVVCGMKFSGQEDEPIPYAGQSSFMLVGGEGIVPTGKALFETPNLGGTFVCDRYFVGAKDCIIQWDALDSANVMAATVQGFYFENVYVRNCAQVEDWLSNCPDPQAVTSLGSGWYHIRRYGTRVQFGTHGSGGNTDYVNSLLTGTDSTDITDAGQVYSDIVASSAPTPNSMWSKYVKDLPHVLDEGRVWYDITDNQRKGIDPLTDLPAFLLANQNVALPVMAGHVTAEMQCLAGATIDGVSRGQTALIAMDKNDFTADSSILTTPNSATGVKIRNVNFWCPANNERTNSGLEPRSRNSVIGWCDLTDDHWQGFGSVDHKQSSTFSNRKLFYPRGSLYGGVGQFSGLVVGMWNDRDFYNDVDSAVIWFDRCGDDGGVQAIGMNAEHRKSHGAIVVDSSGGDGIDMIGCKTEGNFVVFRMKATYGSCEKFRLYGMGGNGVPFRYDHDPNNDYSPPAEVDYTTRLGGTNGKGQSPNYSEYSAAAGGNIVKIDGGCRNFLLALSQPISTVSSENGDPRDAFGRKYVRKDTHLIGYGSWQTEAGSAKGVPDNEHEAPTMMLIGNPD